MRFAMSTTLKERRSPELRSRWRAPAAPEPTAPRARVAYLDNLKVLLVAVIIAAHGIAAYSDLESAFASFGAGRLRLSPEPG